MDMSTREESQAERQETLRTYEEHKRRFIAAGGDSRRFDGLHLVAAAMRRAERNLDDLGRERGLVERPATEREIRQVLGDLAHEAIVARSAGQLREFRRGLWPYGPPMDI
jgi:cob(I)alamin adenosyltransferase